MNYADTIIENYKKKLNCIQYNMNATGIFPDRNEPLKILDYGRESVLKVIYRFRVGFLEELTILFAFCYSKQKFEALIVDLENQQYIKSQVSKDYGKYFILTTKALYYIQTDRNIPFDECNISEDKFPNEQKLLFYKSLLGYYCNRVFNRLTEKHWHNYLSLNKGFRRDYAKKQFIKQFVYSQKDKKAYSKTEAETFADNFLPTLDSNEELSQKYKNFIKYMKEHHSDSMLRFHFLKDYYNDLGLYREQAIEDTLNELNNTFNNIYRDRYFTYRKILYKYSGNSESLKSEFELFTVNELLKVMAITKRSLSNSQKSTKTETELQELTQKIEDIDNKISHFKKIVAILEQDFETMVFDKFSDTDIALFVESIITLDTLYNMKVYITGCSRTEEEKLCLEFSIFQPTIEEPSTNYIFKRLEAIIRFYRSHLLMFDFKINLITYTPKQKEILQSKLLTLKEDFKSFTEYSILVSAFDDIEVVATKQHLNERYETFREIGKYL